MTSLPIWMAAISEKLPSADIACLALTNLQLLYSFVDTAFENFQSHRTSPDHHTRSPFDEDLRSNRPTNSPQDDARIDLLSRLSRDLPDYYLCFVCLRLHLWKRVEPPTWENLNVTHDTYRLRYLDVHLQKPLPISHYPTYSLHELHFMHLQLVMRRFYYGPEFGIPVESLLYTEIRAERSRSFQRLTNNESKGKTEKDLKMALFSVEGRVCTTPPSLYMRTQGIAVFPRKYLEEFLRMRWDWRIAQFYVCMHVSTSWPEFDKRLESLIRRHCSATYSYVADKGSCDKCNNGWQLEIRPLNETNASLILTVWMDLGPGLSTEDPQWKSLFWGGTAEAAAQHKKMDSRLRFERHSVQAGSPNALSVDQIYCRNISLLKEERHREERYRLLVNDGRAGVYMLHGDPSAKPRLCRRMIGNDFSESCHFW
ncbi:unnamed protein product [Penicillium salamii]|nr:unnamed protein product [Penicillium salamii]CAG8395172.1 unnamed protein product [Penicillium salamii]